MLSKKKNYFLKLKVEAFKTSLQLKHENIRHSRRRNVTKETKSNLRKITNLRDLRLTRNKFNTVKEESAKKQFNF